MWTMWQSNAHLGHEDDKPGYFCQHCGCWLHLQNHGDPHPDAHAVAVLREILVVHSHNPWHRQLGMNSGNGKQLAGWLPHDVDGRSQQLWLATLSGHEGQKNVLLAWNAIGDGHRGFHSNQMWSNSGDWWHGTNAYNLPHRQFQIQN